MLLQRLTQVTTGLLGSLCWIMLLLLAPRTAHAQHFKVLHAFKLESTDGQYPQYVSLVRDSKGNLFGTTRDGGAHSDGTVFKVDKKGHESLLYSFMGGTDGLSPYGGVILDGKRNLYGTTLTGGLYGQGNIFKLDVDKMLTTLYSFAGNTQGGNDGSRPYDAVFRDSKGNLYGTTIYGGDYNNCNGETGCGIVFKLDTQGNETILHRFTGEDDGKWPIGGMVKDSSGNLYGTASAGGANSVGTAFEIKPKHKLKVIHQFQPTGDGTTPNAGMILDASGNLYGTTLTGGITDDFGTVFEIDKTGNETIQHSFGQSDGQEPTATLYMDGSGNLYGTTSMTGGNQPWGTVFELIKTGGRYKYKQLYEFTNGPDGATPLGGVVVDKEGNVYGTTSRGGDPTCMCGTVFEISQ